VTPRRGWWTVLGVATALVIAAAAVQGEASVRRLAERGPPTLVVGGLFTVASPPLLVAATLRGQSARLHACRLGHGLKMLVAGTVLLPAGLVLAPLAHEMLPGAWMDGLVDAFQEDYCTRPLTAVMP
jgi:hypothetical protein